MERLLIEGGHKLRGEVTVSGAKNSVLPMLFATLLVVGRHHFTNVPRLRDLYSALELLNHLGCDTVFTGNELVVNNTGIRALVAPYDIVRKMRASFLCLGPLLAKNGRASVSLPGGCAIGSRPINFHLEALEQLGATIDVTGGYVTASCTKLQGQRIIFEMASVGTTEHLMLTACTIEGTTILENAAKEPEICDLADLLRNMGAKITGDGTAVITIEGVSQLRTVSHRVIPDRIEAGTFLMVAAMSGGEVLVKGARKEDLGALLGQLAECGVKHHCDGSDIFVSPSETLLAVDLTTAAYPGFPTDLQAQYMAMMMLADGTSVITETIFENRFMHVQELVRLNANITAKARVATVRGRSQLRGAPVMATDLRASASLVMAGLMAEGLTEVHRIYHLDRGYEGLETKLKGLGAKVKRVS